MTLSNKDASFAEQIHSHIVEIRAILSIEKNNPDYPLYNKVRIVSISGNNLYSSVSLISDLNRLHSPNYGKTCSIDKLFLLNNSITHMLVPEKRDVEAVIDNILEFVRFAVGTEYNYHYSDDKLKFVKLKTDESIERLCIFIFPSQHRVRERFFDWLKFTFTYINPHYIDRMTPPLNCIISHIKLTESDIELSRAFLEGVKAADHAFYL